MLVDKNNEMLVNRLANRIRRKLQFGIIRRHKTAQIYASLHGWPLRGNVSNQPNYVKPTVHLDSNSTSIKLNIGGGKGHPKVNGWTIVDLREKAADVVMDISKEPLPYNSNTVDIIFSSHTLEHIYPQRLLFVLSEVHRVLKSETGVVRILVPDIESAIKAYISDNYSFFQQSSIGQFDSEAPIGGLLASWFYSTRIFETGALKHGDGHVHCFDYDYIAYWLQKAGFSKVWRSSWQQSILPELRSPEFDRHPNDSLFIEASK